MSRPEFVVRSRTLGGSSVWTVVWYPDATQSEGPFDLPDFRRATEEEATELRRALVAAFDECPDTDPRSPAAVRALLQIPSPGERGFWSVVQRAVGPTLNLPVHIQKTVIEDAFRRDPLWRGKRPPDDWEADLIGGSGSAANDDFPWVVSEAQHQPDKLVFTPK